jgi:hypothetical protein
MSIERGERQMQTYLLPTLAIGEGSIDPQTRIINGELSEALFQEAADYLLDDKAYDIVSKAELPGWIFPSSCVDGRTLLDGSCAAGGTTSLVVADALTYRTFMQTGETVKPHAKRTAQFIKDLGGSVGGHNAALQVQADGLDCGCGAQDLLDARDPLKPSILKYMMRHGSDIRSFLTTLSYTKTEQPVGLEIAAETHDMIIYNAQDLVDAGYATNGSDIADAYVEVAGESALETVSGEHVEAFLVLDTRQRRFNHGRFRARFGEDIGLFYCNVLALQKSAEKISIDATSNEATQRFIAAAYYQAATAGVLAGNSLRIIVL